MLFRFKNSLSHTLLLTFALGVAGVLLQEPLNVQWTTTWNGEVTRQFFILLGILLVGDGVVQGLMRVIYRGNFQNTMNNFLKNVVVGDAEVFWIVGFTAAMEELFFRGILTLFFAQIWGPVWGVVVSSFLFNLAHYFKNDGIRFWLMTSIWEGLVMGIGLLYFGDNNILLIMVLHAVHDLLNGGAAIMLVRQMKNK